MISFVIPYPPTPEGKRDFCRRYSLNAYWEGKHWGKRGKDAKELHQLAFVSMRQKRILKQILRYPVEVRFYWNDGLDADNHSAMGKAFLDAMKGYILKNDSKKYVRKVSHEFWDGEGILVEVVRYEQRRNRPRNET